MSELSGEYRNYRLSPRLLIVLQLTAQGMTSREVAEKYTLSIETIKTQKRHIILALNAKNMANAVAIGIRNNLIS